MRQSPRSTECHVSGAACLHWCHALQILPLRVQWSRTTSSLLPLPLWRPWACAWLRFGSGHGDLFIAAVWLPGSSLGWNRPSRAAQSLACSVEDLPGGWLSACTGLWHTCPSLTSDCSAASTVGYAPTCWHQCSLGSGSGVPSVALVCPDTFLSLTSHLISFMCHCLRVMTPQPNSLSPLIVSTRCCLRFAAGSPHYWVCHGGTLGWSQTLIQTLSLLAV